MIGLSQRADRSSFLRLGQSINQRRATSVSSQVATTSGLDRKLNGSDSLESPSRASQFQGSQPAFSTALQSKPCGGRSSFPRRDRIQQVPPKKNFKLPCITTQIERSSQGQINYIPQNDGHQPPGIYVCPFARPFARLCSPLLAFARFLCSLSLLSFIRGPDMLATSGSFHLAVAHQKCYNRIVGLESRPTFDKNVSRRIWF